MKQGGFTKSVCLSDINSGLALWKDYMDAAKINLKGLGHKAIKVRYEDLLTKPDSVIGQFATFCRWEINSDELMKVCQFLKPNRAFAFKNDSFYLKPKKSVVILRRSTGIRALLEKNMKNSIEYY